MASSTTRSTAVQVTCVTVAIGNSGHEGITHLGGPGGLWTKAEVIAALESPYPRYSFYTEVNGRVAWVGVRTGQYGKYLQTYADGYWNNNLLALARCY
jgi:hypothetical protein